MAQIERIRINIGSKDSAPFLKNSIQDISIFFDKNNIKVTTTQKERAFLIFQNLAPIKRTVRNKTQNTGLSNEKLNLYNSFE